MANTVFELQGKIGLDTTQFYTNMKNVMKTVEDFRKSISGISTTVNSVQSGFRTLSTSFTSTDTRIRDLQRSLEQAQRSTSDARLNVLNLTNAYEQSKAATGENSEQTKALAKELEKARQRLEECEHAEHNANTELENYQSTLHSANENTQNLGNSVNDTSGKFSSFGDILKANILSTVIIDGLKTVIGKVKELGDAAVNAVKDFTKQSVAVGMSFDAAMSQVAATMGLSMDEMANQVGEVDLAWGHFSGNLRDYAKEMGKNTAFSATEAAQALNYMALAGYDVNKSMNMLPSVLNLAAAGGMELASASDMITDTQTALGLSIERTSELVNQMAKTASRSNTSVAQLGDAMLTVGGNAKSLNGGIIELADGSIASYDGVTELNAALGILADNGTKASEAGTKLRNILTSLSSDKFKTNFGDQFGISAYDAEGEMRALKDIFADMNAVMSSMTDEERNNLITDVFNARDKKDVIAFLDTTQERWNSLTAEILDAQGAAQQMANTQLDNLTGNITIFKSALEGAQIALSDKLSPSLSEFVKLGTSQISGLTKALEENGFSGVIDNIAGYIDQWRDLISEKISEFTNNSDLSEAFGKIGNFILDSLYQSAQKIPERMQFIQTLIEDGMDNISRNLPAFTNIGVKIIESFSSGFSGIIRSDSFGNFITSIVNALDKSIPVIADGISNVIGALAEKFGDFAEIIIPAIANVLTVSVEAIAKNVTPIVSAITKVLPVVIESLVSNIAPLIDAATQVVTSLIDSIVADDGILDNIVDGVGKIVDAIVDNIDPILIAIQDASITISKKLLEPETFSKILSAATSIASKLFIGTVKALGSAGGFIVEFTDEMIKMLSSVDWFGIVTESLAGIGKAIIGAFGIDMTEWDAYWEELGGLAFDVMQSYADDIDEFKRMWQDGIDALEDFGGSVFDFISSIPEKFHEIVESAKKWGSDLIENFASGLKDNPIVKGVEGIAQGIKDYLGFSEPKKGALSNFHTYAPDMIDLFVSGINENKKLVENALENAFELPEIKKPEIDIVPEVEKNYIPETQKTFIEVIPEIENPEIDIIPKTTEFAMPKIQGQFIDIIPELQEVDKDIFQKKQKSFIEVIPELQEVSTDVLPEIQKTFVEVVPEIQKMNEGVFPKFDNVDITPQIDENSIFGKLFDGIKRIKSEFEDAFTAPSEMEYEIKRGFDVRATESRTNAEPKSRGGVVVNFTQNNTSPEPMDEYQTWRQTQKAIGLMKVQLGV